MGEEGTEGFGAKSFSVTDGLSEGIPDGGDADEESVSDEDEGEPVGSVLPVRLDNGDHIELESGLVHEEFNPEDQTAGELVT